MQPSLAFPRLAAGELERALALLARLFDSRNQKNSGAWRWPPTVDAGEIAWLAGLGLDPDHSSSVTHDEAIAGVLAARDRISISQGALAFVASLDGPRPHGCFLEAVQLAHAMPAHSHHGPEICMVCGLRGSFERRPALEFLDWHRQGSGIPGSIPWALLALARLNAMPEPSPSPRAWALLAHALRQLDDQPPGATAITAAKSLQGDLLAAAPGLVETLGFAGVLDAAPHAGMTSGFLSFAARERRPRVRVELDAPTGFWTGAHGVNWGSVEALFGLHKQDPLPPLPAPAVAAAPPRRKAARASALKRRPAKARDLWCLPVAEGCWALVYVWRIDTKGARPFALAEFVGPLIEREPPAKAPLGLATRPRYDGRWQHLTSGLDKTTGALLIAEGVDAPVVTGQASAPSRVPGGSGKDLCWLARSCYPELQ